MFAVERILSITRHCRLNYKEKAGDSARLSAIEISRTTVSDYAAYLAASAGSSLPDLKAS
jgi:hypothetical protein